MRIESRGVVLTGNSQITGQVSSLLTTTVTPTGTTATINWNNGNSQILTLASATGTVTVTLSNPQAGASYIIKVIQHASAAKAITWPSSVKWVSGTAPTISTGASDVDIITLFFDGTNYYSNSVQDLS